MAFIKYAVASYVLMASLSANAAYLDGKQIGYEYLYPDNMATYWTPGPVTVGAGAELNGVSGPNEWATVDIGDNYLEFDFFAAETWSSAAFNGVHVFDLNANLAAFDSVSLDASSNMIGLDSSRISFDQDNIYLNWQGLSFDANSVVRLNLVATSSGGTHIPEPSSVALLALAALGLWSRHHSKRV